MMWTGEVEDDGSEIKMPRIKERPRGLGKLTLPNSRHLGFQQNLVLKLDDLALVRVYNLQHGVDNWRWVREAVSSQRERDCHINEPRSSKPWTKSDASAVDLNPVSLWVNLRRMGSVNLRSLSGWTEITVPVGRLG